MNHRDRGWMAAAEMEAAHDEVAVSPRWSTAVPYCAKEECDQYDGKRCKLMGQRPGNVCVPVVMGMAELLNRADD